MLMLIIFFRDVKEPLRTTCTLAVTTLTEENAQKTFREKVKMSQVMNIIVGNM